MKTITFTCETVTPLFLAGADGTTPELRAPSIKGALRFWWRAMNGHLLLPELKQREAIIFGGTEQEQGRSKVTIRLPNQKLKTSTNKLVLHKDFELPAFKTHQKFTIDLSLTENEKNIFNVEQLKTLFILTCTLGGLGKRTRRGMGSIRIIEIDGKAFQCITLNDIFTNLDKINKDKFFEKERLILSNFGRNENYPYIKQIELGDRTNNNYLWEISNTTHEFSKRENYKFSPGYASNNKRLASPIYVSLIKMGEELRPIITTLNTVPVKADESLQKEFRETILNRESKQQG